MTVRVTHVRVRTFRNLHDVLVEPGPDACILYGANGQGKTNILEALYLLSNLQSFRTHRVHDMLPFGKPVSQMEADVEGYFGCTRLQLFVDAKGKRPLINGNSPHSTSEYLAELPTVIFSTDDLLLAKGNQDLRRRYLDRATFLADPRHLGSLRCYRRALRQRNAALRCGGGDLRVWDDQLSLYGAAVMKGRQTTLKRLQTTISDIHGSISGGNESVELDYPLKLNGKSEEEFLLDRLRSTEYRDRRVGHTGVGPHRDTVGIRLSGRRLEEHASQGQLRTVALGLKLSLLYWGRDVRGVCPMFLLDDPGSELDAERLGALGSFLLDWAGQVIITGTTRSVVPLDSGRDNRYYRVEKGVIYPE